MDIREFLPSPIQNQTPGSDVSLATPTFSQANTGTPTPVKSDSELTEHDLGLKIDGPAQPRLWSYPKSKFGSRNVHFRQHTIVLFLFWNIVYKKIHFFVLAVDIFLPPMQIQLSLKLALKIGKKLKKNFCKMQKSHRSPKKLDRISINKPS